MKKRVIKNLNAVLKISMLESQPCRNNFTKSQSMFQMIKTTLLLMLLKSLVFAQHDANVIEHQDLSFVSYKPIYFGYTSYYSEGNETGEVKFQLSFKYELFKESNLFMGFTQKAFWSIHKESQPFREINFAPEIFYTLDLGKHFKSLTFGLFKHESTGEDGLDSYGWNLSYLEATFLYDHLSFSLMVWGPALGLNEYDATYSRTALFDYYGYGELYVRYLSPLHNQHTLTFRKGEIDDVYGFQYQWDIDLDNLISLHKKGGIWNSNLFIQYWEGYGESLKTFDIYTQRFSFGISIVH